MIEFIKELSQKYYNKGIVLDTNLFLLYVIGSIDIQRIKSFKRTKQFLEKDFQLLQGYLSNFKNKIATPNILTEVNSFLNQLESNEKNKFFGSFSKIINNFDENYFKSYDLSVKDGFNKFGLTDISIFELSKDKYIVLTDDFALYNYLGKNKIDAINFNHIRTLNW